MSNTAFGPKDYESEETFTFDFVNLYDSSILTISTAVVTAATVSGVDASPSSMISGAAQISGTKVLQELVGGVPGAAYHLRCKVTLSDGSIVIIGADLDVRSF